MNASPKGKRGARSEGSRGAKHLTLRNVPPEITANLAREARRLGTSQNAAAIELLRRALGLAGAPYDNGLGRYAGDWSRAEYEEFTSATAMFEQVDEELWR